jgi:uncharacterized protein (TIGR00251 family)
MDPHPAILTASPKGVIVNIRVIPRAGRSGVEGIRAGALLVRVAAAPVEGSANAELIEVLARALKLPRRNLTVVSGERSRTKRVLVEGVPLATVQQQLSDILPGQV